MHEGRSIKTKDCEFCFATEDLTEAFTGAEGDPVRLLVCEDAKACQERWPALGEGHWPAGTVGVPPALVG